MSELTKQDVDFIVRMCGGTSSALAYCRKIAAADGPLAGAYRRAVLVLLKEH